MSKLSVPLLYRHILRAAKQFPSIKRNSIVEEIKVEFTANKVCTPVAPDGCLTIPFETGDTMSKPS